MEHGAVRLHCQSLAADGKARFLIAVLPMLVGYLEQRMRLRLRHSLGHSSKDLPKHE